MKWRNTKERELFTSGNSINNEKIDCCDYQEKEEIITYSPSAIDHKNETKNSHIDENN
jgi:hypothetical protein